MKQHPRNFPVVAIDGPAGAGKSTVSRQVARALNYTLLDTGAIYRSVALLAGEQGVAEEPNKVAAIAHRLAEGGLLRFEERESGEPTVWLGPREVTRLIRTPEVSACASRTSSIPEVRAALLELQRSFGRNGRVVVEGRDIGTVVFPDAEAKFFLTASVDARAARRFDELREKNAAVTLDQVAADVRERDRRDSSRPVAPLQQALDAHLVDSTGRSIEQVVEEIVNYVRSAEAKLQRATS